MGAEQQAASAKAGGSRFAATCGLLRQFMKEQGAAAAASPAVTIDFMPAAADGFGAAPQERRTMELFPQQAGTLKDSQDLRMWPEKAQLTIFYGGRTMVFDDFPAEKAKELLQLAGSFEASDAGSEPVNYHNSQAGPFLSEMPMARKASLQRFLEKRKSRLAAADPYYPGPYFAPKEDGIGGKPVEAADHGAPWLAVSSPVLHLN